MIVVPEDLLDLDLSVSGRELLVYSGFKLRGVEDFKGSNVASMAHNLATAGFISCV